MSMCGRTDLKPSKGYHFETGAYVEYDGEVAAGDRDALVVQLNQHANEIIKNTPADKQVFKKMCTYDEANTLLCKAGGCPSYIP